MACVAIDSENPK